MKEKKVIDYTRTYRRIEADKKKCVLYIVILLLLGFLLMWTQIDDLTRIICKICAGVLKKYEPHMYVGIRSETYPLFGKISYLSAETVYPGIQISLINAGISLGIIILLACLPWKGRPLAIYLILCSAIHLINSLWFVFGEKYFPYTLTVYSKLYMLQEISQQGVFFHHFAWLAAFTNSSQKISTHLLTVLTKRCNVILQIEQEQKGGCLYEYK